MQKFTKLQYINDLKQDIRDYTLRYTNRTIMVAPIDIFSGKVNISQKYKEYQFKSILADDIIRAFDKNLITLSQFNQWAKWFFDEFEKDGGVSATPLNDILFSMGDISNTIIMRIIKNWGGEK